LRFFTDNKKKENHSMKNSIIIFTTLCILAVTPVGAQAFGLKIIEETVTKISKVESTVNKGHKGFKDAKNKTDDSMNTAIQEGAWTAGTVTYGVGAATAHGAGSLAGYAGMASAVSNLGLGGVTTSIAGAMGSSASGAAATAVVTSVVGGPLVMGAILVMGTAGAAYGVYKGGQAVAKWMTD
jgi:hypothetical protein